MTNKLPDPMSAVDALHRAEFALKAALERVEERKHDLENARREAQAMREQFDAAYLAISKMYQETGALAVKAGFKAQPEPAKP